MRIVFDSLVAQSRPNFLAELHQALPDSVIDFFNPFESPATIAGALSDLRPDILVVDPSWLMISPLLMTLLAISGNSLTRPVLATKGISDVVKVQSSHHNYFDVINLENSPDEIGLALRQIHRGESSLERDNLWTRAPRPNHFANVLAGPQDEIDFEILDLICIGLRNQDIAAVVYVSLQTVRKRISAMLERSGVSNRTELAWRYTNQALLASMLQNINQHSAGVTHN